MKQNELIFVGQLAHELIQYQNCFGLLISRKRFVNCYVLRKWTYYLQLFLISNKTNSKINKFLSYFLWIRHTLLTNRDSLFLTMAEGELRFKKHQTQGEALILHSSLSLIYQNINTFNHHKKMSVMHDIFTKLHLNINKCRYRSS